MNGAQFLMTLAGVMIAPHLGVSGLFLGCFLVAAALFFAYIEREK